MKTKIILLLYIFLTTISFSQTIETEKTETYTEEVRVSEPKPIAFKLVDVPPLAPDCNAKWKLEKLQKCTLNYIFGHVNRKLNTDLVSELGLTGLIRIDVTFTIDKEGNPKDITASGGPEILNQNAIGVLQTLPQLIPAIHQGEIVEVYLKFPVALDIR